MLSQTRNDLSWVVLEVVHICDAAVNAVDAHCVHCVAKVWVRSMQLAVWHGTIGFLQLDQKQQREFDM